ncbi:MAG: holo-[acyl-carrier-protein] synthase [Phycisphaerae bacterium]|nr:MAG: holo-[acyl-carrier-protein] synthase [Phycisphaerae bacterium]
MNIVSHGIDIVECPRIADLLSKHPDRFLNRILTPKERERADRLHSPIPHIAGRFAAKEAILKVLGTGWRGGIAWTDIEITNDEMGAPLAELSGMCAQVAKDLEIERIMLSISHTDTVATASALGLRDG